MSAIATVQIETVLQRLCTDKAFRVKYNQDPDRALEAYLSPEEIRALKCGDGHLLQQLRTDCNWEDALAALCGPHPGD